MNADERIDAGFAALKSAVPRRGSVELATTAARRSKRARLRQRLAGAGVVATALVLAAVALRPTSALAALQEAEKLSNRQPIIHMHFRSWQAPATLTTPPWPSRPPSDLWRLSDRLVRAEGHSLSVMDPKGTGLSHDDRFPVGLRWPYDAAHDQIWSVDGTIGWALKHYRQPPTVRQGRLTEYAFAETDAVGNRSISHIFVDPASKLVQSATDENLTPNGDRSGGSATVTYPTRQAAEREIPRFPKGLHFATERELREQLRRYVRRPEQTKVVGGVRSTLCAVVVYGNIPDGVGVGVVTVGGGVPAMGAPEFAEVRGQRLLPVRRTDWLGLHVEASHTRFVRVQTYGGRRCLLNQSENLLYRAPGKLTVRVPVWRPGGSHAFAGYATFTTSRIVYNVSESALDDERR